MTATVAVTGATGLIGTALRGALAARGVPVRALVRTAERAASVRDAEAVVVGCVTDARAVAEVCAGSAAIVHLVRSTHQLADLCRFDYPALHTVVDAANANGAELHFASSQAVFGGARTFPPPVLDDATPPAPSSPYGAMKAAWEVTTRALCGVPPVIYRLPIVVPARLADGAPWLQWLLFTSVCDLDVPGRRLRLRPQDTRVARGGLAFVHVEDVAATIAANLFRPEAHGTLAMLADAEYVPFRDLAGHYADLARRHGFAVTTEWTVPDGRPDAVEAMFRYDTSVAVARLGFASPDGRARLLAKATDRFVATIGARTA